VDYIRLSLNIAKESLLQNPSDVPIVATIVNHKSGMYHSFSNRVYADSDPTAHAEVLAVRWVSKEFKTTHLEDYDLYVTLEPCSMCAAVISFARIRRLYFGAYDPKSGGVVHGPKVFQSAALHYKPEVIGGVHERECEQVMKDFFAKIRELKKD